MGLRYIAAHRSVSGAECIDIQAHFGRHCQQYVFIGNPPPFCVMRRLQAPQQLQAAPGQLFGNQHGGGRRRRIEYCRGVAQQAFEVPLAKWLPGALGNALVMGHHVIAQLRRHSSAMCACHHPATVGHDRQNIARGVDQRLGAIAPAAQGVVDVMQDRCSGHVGLRVITKTERQPSLAGPGEKHRYAF